MSKLSFQVSAPAELSERLTAAILAAGKDKSMPMITNVHLTVDAAGKRMFADATDRFVLIRADLSDLVDEWPDTDVDVKVPAVALTGWIKSIPKRELDVVELQVSDKVVTFALRHNGSSQNIATFDGDFVKVESLITSALQDTDQDDKVRVSTILIDPARLAILGKLKVPSLTIKFGGNDSRPLVATSHHRNGEGEGAVLTVMIMPMRKL